MTLLGGVIATLAVLTGFAMPGPSRPHIARIEPPARGPLADVAEHPEWKQFLVLAAIRRAGELDRLRDLPGDKVATLPMSREDAEPDAATGSILEASGGAIPVDIGETSSTELPIRQQELTPLAQTPESFKAKSQSLRQLLRKIHRAKLRGRPPTKPLEAAISPLSALLTTP